MRTTLDIDSDVLRTLKELATRRRQTAGRVASDLIRQALAERAPSLEVREAPPRSGFQPFESRGALVTDADVNRLRDELDL